MIRCAITNGAFPGPAALRTDWLQLREKHLSARRLTALAQQLIESSATLIINSRLDVALAVGAAGVHLPGNSPPPSRFRALCPPGFLIGVSCHSVDDAERAAGEGADYVFLSPIFPSPSKPGYGPELGLIVLGDACRRVRIPVLALGGVNEGNARDCVEAGAAGYASISAFSPE